MAFKREKVIKSAEKYVAKGKLEAAIKEYRKVLADNPNDINTLNRVGDLYARAEKPEEAIKLFSQIAEKYTRDGFFVKAIAIYKKILKIDAKALPVYERLAELYHDQGLINEARSQYQFLADYYQKQENATSAITIYQRMAEMEPSNPTYHLKLAELYTSQQLTDKALHEYRQIADLMLVEGKADEAVQVYEKALPMVGQDLSFVRDSLRTLVDGGHTGAAAHFLSKANALNPAAAGLAEEVGLIDRAAEEESAADESAEAASEVDVEQPGDGFLPATDATGSFDRPSHFAEPETALPDESSVPAASLDTDDEEFVFDLDDDAPAATEVRPPEDIDVSGDDEEEEEFEIEIEIDPVATLDEADLVDPNFGEATVFTPGFAEDEGAEEARDDEGDETAAAVPEEPAERPAPAPAAPAKESAEDESVEVEWDLDAMADLDVPPPADDEEPVEAPAPTPEPAEAPAAGTPAAGTPAAGTPAAGTPAAGTPAPELPAAETQKEGQPFELAFDFEDDAESPAYVQPPEDLDATMPARAAVPAPPAAETPAAETPAAETPAAEPPPPVRRDEDLVAEARVFAKYGLHEKAADRLDELLASHPRHLEGLMLRARLELQTQQPEAVIVRANILAEEAERQEDPRFWRELRAELEHAGYGFDGERVTRMPGAADPTEDDRIGQLLQDLNLDSYEKPSAAAGGVDSLLTPEGPATPPAQPAKPPASQAPTSFSLADELAGEEWEEPAPAPPTSPAAASPAVDLDETGMSWLDEPTAEPEPAGTSAASSSDAIFDEEDDFFDLAAELEEELGDDAELEGVVLSSMESQEQSLEEVIEGFKQGVAENLSTEDYDTHFNLGIAYREMGLLDEAIGEFQLASKDQRYLLDSASMLGMCFVEKGLPELAVKWYQKGLEAPGARDEAIMGLLYDLGTTYQSLGENDKAYKAFVEIYGMSSTFRDVASKLQESAPQQT